MSFYVKPIRVKKVVPLALEPCKQLCDTMIAGLDGTLRAFHVHAELTPWAASEGETMVTRLEAGRALSARLALTPAGAGTQVDLDIEGSILVLGRKEILAAILEKLREMGG